MDLSSIHKESCKQLIRTIVCQKLSAKEKNNTPKIDTFSNLISTTKKINALNDGIEAEEINNVSARRKKDREK